MAEVSGGKCVRTKPSIMDLLGGGPSSRDHYSHVSTSRDIDASRHVPVHICDHCNCLFVPDASSDAQLKRVLAKPTKEQP